MKLIVQKNHFGRQIFVLLVRKKGGIQTKIFHKIFKNQKKKFDEISKNLTKFRKILKSKNKFDEISKKFKIKKKNLTKFRKNLKSKKKI